MSIHDTGGGTDLIIILVNYIKFCVRPQIPSFGIKKPVDPDPDGVRGRGSRGRGGRSGVRGGRGSRGRGSGFVEPVKVLTPGSYSVKVC